MGVNGTKCRCRLSDYGFSHNSIFLTNPLLIVFHFLNGFIYHRYQLVKANLFSGFDDFSCIREQVVKEGITALVV